MTIDDADIHCSSSNIFGDLELPDAETHLLEARIVADLYRLYTGHGITQAEAGEMMGLSQVEMARLFKGRFREHSIEQLRNFLAAFGQDASYSSTPDR